MICKFLVFVYFVYQHVADRALVVAKVVVLPVALVVVLAAVKVDVIRVMHLVHLSDKTT